MQTDTLKNKQTDKTEKNPAHKELNITSLKCARWFHVPCPTYPKGFIENSLICHNVANRQTDKQIKGKQL